MAFSVSPSVIVKEIDATGSIAAVANAPAAIAGVFNWGPLMEPVLITSETNLVNRFGRPSDDNAETFFVAADYLAYSSAIYVTRVAEDATAATAAAFPFQAKYVGALGNSLGITYVSGATKFAETLFEVGELTTGSVIFGSRVLTFATTEDDIATRLSVGDTLKIGNNSIGYQQFEVTTVAASAPDGATGAITYTVGISAPYALPIVQWNQLKVSREWRFASYVSSAPNEGNFHVVVYDVDGKISGAAGSIMEIYDNVSTNQSARTYDGSSNYYVDVIGQKSQYISVNTSTLIGADSSRYAKLTGGANGDNENTISFGAVAMGYDTFRNSEEIDVSFILQGKAIGGVSGSGLSNYILSNIIDYRKDAVLFVSPSYDAVVLPTSKEVKLENVLAYRKSLQNSSYWFMDSGYKYRYDKYNDKYRWVPLNGDIAGLSARIDPWESPAGYKRGIVKNAIKLAYNPEKSHRDALFGSDVNPVISQVGQGIMLFGDKTGLGTESAFNRINVRRLFITVEKAIANVAATFLFDFNDEFTQNQFKNTITPYLSNIQGKRGIIDFRVVADSSINTPDIVDANVFKGNVFIKPARTISVIELNFVATRTGIDFNEIIGQI